MTEGLPEDVIEGLLSGLPDGLPDSARQVYLTLSTEGPLTHKELVELTGMPARTVRYAIARLREEGHVDQRRNLMDSRQRFFYVTKQGAEGAEEPRGGLSDLR